MAVEHSEYNLGVSRIGKRVQSTGMLRGIVFSAPIASLYVGVFFLTDATRSPLTLSNLQDRVWSIAASGRPGIAATPASRALPSRL